MNVDRTDPRYVKAREYVRLLARQGAVVSRYWYRADNHEPTRQTRDGYMVRVPAMDGRPSVVVAWADDLPTRGTLNHMLLLVDDGATVAPHYYAGGNPHLHPGAAFFYPFTTGTDWSVGPCNAVHAKVMV